MLTALGRNILPWSDDDSGILQFCARSPGPCLTMTALVAAGSELDFADHCADNSKNETRTDTT